MLKHILMLLWLKYILKHLLAQRKASDFEGLIQLVVRNADI
jgi:hypothetical protein